MGYSEEFKRQVVVKVMSPGIVTKDICRKLGVHVSTVREWRALYGEELKAEIERIWTEYREEKPVEEKVDIEALLREATIRENIDVKEDMLPVLGEVLASGKRIDQYALEEKYVIVVKVRALDSDEKGRFLRLNGFKLEHIRKWENELLAMTKNKIKNDEYIKRLEEENWKLKKDLKESELENKELKILIELKKKYPDLFKNGEGD